MSRELETSISRSDWKRNLLWAVGICVVIVFLIRTYRNASAPFRKTQVLPFTRNLDRVALSPDGSRLLLLKTNEQLKGTDATETHRLEVYEVQSSAKIVSVDLPRAHAAVAEPWFVIDRLHVCDQGKYLLAYIDNGKFLVLDGHDYKTLAEIAFPQPKMPSGEEIVLNSGCAANASTAVFELVHAPSPVAAIRIFDLNGGQQVGEIDSAVTPGRETNLLVSPSGTFASIVTPARGGTLKGDDLEILDLRTKVFDAPVHTGMNQVQAVFVTDEEIAVASADTGFSSADTVVNLFDIRTGDLTHRLTADRQMARAPIGTSADGRFVMGYTGDESLREEALQIKNAHFTIWDRGTGKVIAQSPELHISKVSTRPLDLSLWSTKKYVRPEIFLSQSGTAVVVSGYSAEPVDVYTLK